MVQASAGHPHQSQRQTELTWTSVCPCGLQPTLALFQFISTLLANCVLQGAPATEIKTTALWIVLSQLPCMCQGELLLCVAASNPASLKPDHTNTLYVLLKRAILFLQLGGKYSKVRSRMYCRRFGKYLYKEKN